MSITLRLAALLLGCGLSFANTIQIAGPAANPLPGNTFSLNVTASGVTDLYAFQFDIILDPTILFINSVVEGPFLSGTGNFIGGFIDNGAGTLTFTANSLNGAVPGVAGSGVLAVLELQALAPGTSAITFANGLLLDSDLNDIPTAVFQPGQVTVDPPADVPEPASVVLLAFGLAATLARARRSHIK
jgi:hypothetical protein